MDRYKIAIRKSLPEEPPKIEKVESFGFNNLDQDLNDRADAIRNRPFYCGKGEAFPRVGIIAEDLDHIFMASQTHFFNRSYIRCEKGECCQIERPCPRIACCLVIYNEENLGTSRIVPWVFGRTTFNKLKEINEVARLDQNDFFLRKPKSEHNYSYNPWEVHLITDSLSLWQKDEAIKGGLLRRASALDLTKYLGRQITNEDLIIGRASRHTQPSYRQPRIQRGEPIEEIQAAYDDTISRRRFQQRVPLVDTSIDDLFRDLI